MPAKLSEKYVLPDTVDAFKLHEETTHRKLLKRMRELQQGDSLDKVCMLTTVGGSVVPLRDRLQAYPALGMCIEDFGIKEANGTNTFYSRLKLEKEMVSQGIQQTPDYCSVLFISSDRTQRGSPGRTHVDFHWFLQKDKTLAVVLVPSTASSIMCPIVHAHVDDNGLMQEFRVCNTCGKRGPSVWLCPKCAKVGYCDRACQMADWALHKTACTLKQEMDLSGAIAAASQVCVVCGSSGSLKACKCKTLYCGTACRDSDWPTHRRVCKKLQGAKEESTCSKCSKPTDLKHGAVCPKCALK
jgi:hypothetical protein